MTECAIDTPEGTYVADVGWATAELFRTLEAQFSCSIAPQICAEIWSQSNSEEEIEMKRRLYFGKGAMEFWYCDERGAMTFFNPQGQLENSEICAEFPTRVTPHDREET